MVDMLSTRPATRARPTPRVSRGQRVLRGSLGAVVATLLAAASHGLAGGVITWASVAATIIFTLPLCVAFAGKVGSLWRLTTAVAAAQFLYHWMFAGLGLASGAGPQTGIPAAPHAAHLATLQSFSPDLASAGAADAAMWLGHAIAAIATIGLLHRGERAFLALRHALRRVPPDRASRTPAPLARPVRALGVLAEVTLRDRLLTASAITRRGPPRCA